MGKSTVVPFGPQHPVLPEPIHLDLVIEDEKVVEAIPSIGFVHRGLESLVAKKEFTEYPALSREDNETEICPECGVCEAIEAYEKSVSK